MKYEPAVNAPVEGAWDRSGPELVWVQDHHALVVSALRSWKGDPVEMKMHIPDEIAGSPVGGSGTTKIQRAKAGALLWELKHKAVRCPRPLYRGSHIEPKGLQSWSTARKVAELWASKNGGRVFELPKGTKGLWILQYTSSAFDAEKEWLVWS